MESASDFWQWYHDNGLIPNLWKGFTGQLSNEKIADENLDYQAKRNLIEDLRYWDETKYNRAFAEDERDYNRALQQQIFEREDTAITRQMNQLSQLGLNPLSQNMSGLQAGSPVSASVAPSPSSRGGTALHNDFQSEGLIGMVSPLLNMVSGINDVMTGSKTRDALISQTDGQILQNQSQAIDNLIKANKNGIKIDDDGSLSLSKDFKYKEQDLNELDYRNKGASTRRNEREDKFQNDYGVADGTNTYVRAVTDAGKQADRFYDAVGIIGKDVKDTAESVGKILKKSAEEKLNQVKEATKNASKNIFNGAKNGLKKAGNKLKGLAYSYLFD